ncbi:MAG: xanthine dehydrogenase family protein subunit M [Chloroflexi bacterium]|nr:xanthine dehydrogenase family protein subunit M [Chloroflexota bacterium]
MKPGAFKYFAPTTMEEAVGLLGLYGPEAKILAGGQSLMPLLNMRLARPSVIVDINRIGEMDYIRPSDGGIAIGALTRERRVEDDPIVAERLPLLAALVKWIGHPQIRNRGTVCGSIAHGDPAAELPAAALALDAELAVVGKSGTRTLSPDDLYLGYLATSLAPDEIIREVRFPGLPANAGWSIQEVARRHGDFALVGVIAVLGLTEGRISEARLVCFGVGGRPVRFPEIEGQLVGSTPSEDLFSATARQVSASVDPDGDIHASAAYRKEVAGVLTRRALEQASERAKGGIQS